MSSTKERIGLKGHPGPTTFIRSLAVLCLIGPLLALAPAPVEAGSRGSRVSVGIGVVSGLILLNKLSKGQVSTEGRRSSKGSGSSASRSTKKKSVAKAEPERSGRGKSSESRKRKTTADSGSKKTRSASREKSRSNSEADDEDSNENTETTSVETETAIEARPPSDEPADGGGADGNVAVSTVSTSAASPLISSRDEITAAQEHLIFLGYDVEKISGDMDEGTRNAVRAYQTSIGAPATGALTVEQLQKMFVLAAEKSAKP